MAQHNAGARKQDIEYAWYKTRSTNQSMPGNTPLRELQRRYWQSVVGTQNNYEGNRELEWRWLHSLTGVGATTKAYADLWREAVVGAGAIPVNDIGENQILYYIKTP